MRGLWIILAGCVVLGLTARSHGQDKKDANKEKLVGTWEVAKGDAPPGSTLEFTKDGKIKMVAKGKDKDLTAEGTYTVDGDKIVSIIKFGGKEVKETNTIKTLTDKVLVTVDEKGRTDEFKKVK